MKGKLFVCFISSIEKLDVTSEKSFHLGGKPHSELVGKNQEEEETIESFDIVYSYFFYFIGT